MKALFDRAVRDHQAGRLEDAEAAYRRILDAVPRHADTLHLLGVVRTQRGAFREGIDLIRRAIALRATPSAVFHCNLGVAHRGLGESEPAIVHLERALSLKPDYAEAHNNLAAVLKDVGRAAEAEPYCRRAIALRPESPAAHFALGAVLQDLGRLGEAREAYDEALTLQPGYAAAHLNLGSVLAAGDDLEAAIAHYRRALSLRPDQAEAHFNLGAALQDCGELDAALAEYERAQALKPDYADAHWNEALLSLSRGDYRKGFEKFEWRFRRAGYEAPPFAQPQWEGDDLTGRTILLWAEQGYGDSFQFVRYAPLVKARSPRGIILQCIPGTEKTMASVAGIDRVISRDDVLPAFDCHASLMSLPGLLQPGRPEPPADIPYIHAAPESLALFRDRIAASPGLKAGIVWRGNPGNTHDRRRSIAAETIAPLCGIPGVSWFSLQPDAQPDEIAALAQFGTIDDLGPLLTDWSRTAAALSVLDLVVTVDTAVAHLAGALGRPAFVLLAHVAHWCWLRDRTDSPWYPAARLFRQASRGDWGSVIPVVEDAISRLPGAKTGSR